MSTKPKPTATRASTRTKTPAPTETRTTRTKPNVQFATPSSPIKATRKPLVTKDNEPDVKIKETSKSKSKVKDTVIPSDADREPIMAYLRIRPHLGDDEPSSTPYLEPLTTTSVRMTDPTTNPTNISRPMYRASTVSPSSTYTFSHIFLPSTSQSDFFTRTTLPLVRDVLNGQNALLFAYGVTNSGKTYSVQGGTKEGSAGILPRTLDVIFNSVEGLHGDGRYRPARLNGIELASPSDTPNTSHLSPNLPIDDPCLAQLLSEHLSTTSSADVDIDSTVLTLDRNYEYSIWLSYAEVYNEKIYDLLASVTEGGKGNNTSGSRSTPGTPTQPFLLTRQALSVKPSPPSDSDSDCPGKYISNLRTFHLTSASSAKALLKLGQLHRRVFGTLANTQSSRSHGLVFIKVLRMHRGERNDPSAIQVSRLTLVDLAGSERTKYTNTTGERLREAGSINKSLMVLGQCMEVMRANQKKVAVSLAGQGRGDTRDVKRGLGVVPFRHSKLTEVLMDYFVGDGRAVMIVNVNPYDTGYDENSHVMKFAALAREVYTTPALAPIQRLPVPSSPSKPTTKSQSWKTREPLRDPEIVPFGYTRKVTIETGGGKGKKVSQAHVEVTEEDEEMGEPGEDEGNDDAPINPLVDALFDEVEALRMQLFESEMRCAIIEAEIRVEVMREMEERMRSMEKMYTRRLRSEVEQNELKTDAKIDLLHRSGFIGRSPMKAGKRSQTTEELEENDVEMNLVGPFEEEQDSDDELAVAPAEEMVIDSEEESISEKSDESRSPSPLAGKGKVQKLIREPVPRGLPSLPLPPGYDDDERDAEEDITEDGSEDSEIDEKEEEEIEDSTDEDNTDDNGNTDEDEWVPPPAKSTRSSSSHTPGSKAARSKATPSASKGKMSKLQREMDSLSLSSVADDSMEIAPEETKLKKKRQIGKKI